MHTCTQALVYMKPLVGCGHCVSGDNCDYNSFTSQVTTNGIIYFGQPAVECCPVRFQDLRSDAVAFVAPYWIDNDPSVQGSVSYEALIQGDPLVQEVSDFISKSQGTVFSGEWMLVAFWLDVPEAFLEEQVSIPPRRL